jgi:hypothetical protein
MNDKSDNIKKDRLIECLEKSLGVVSTACAKANLSRQTHYRWLTEDEDYKARVDDILNVTLDYVEGKLFNEIQGGNMTGIIFYLKTKGKSRGYVERFEIKKTDPIEEMLESKSDDEILEQMEHLTNELRGVVKNKE